MYMYICTCTCTFVHVHVLSTSQISYSTCTCTSYVWLWYAPGSLLVCVLLVHDTRAYHVLVHTCTCTVYMIKSMNHNSLGCEQPYISHTGLDVKMEVTQCAGRVSANTRHHHVHLYVFSNMLVFTFTLPPSLSIPPPLF